MCGPFPFLPSLIEIEVFALHVNSFILIEKILGISDQGNYRDPIPALDVFIYKIGFTIYRACRASFTDYNCPDNRGLKYWYYPKKPDNKLS